MAAKPARRTPIWRLLSRRIAADLRLSFRLSALGRWTQMGATPERLLIAHQDIRTADPTVAADIYAGVFVFSGQIVEAGGRSPFEIEPVPSPEWAAALHGFGWLRHLRASDSPLSRSNARALVDDWVRSSAKLPDIAWRPDVVARRILSWLSQSPLILEGCDRPFYQRFMRSLARQVRFLRRSFSDVQDGLPRLQAAAAFVAAAVSISGQERHVRSALRVLDLELERQFLPDGGHVSRNPAAILDALIEILPIRQAISARGVSPSPTLMGTIDRMMPMIRFFRHGDGSFARFNGVGVTPRGLVATVMAHDDSFGTAPSNASHSGYQRMEGGQAVVIMDTGAPPPAAVSGSAHAGALSFEFSSGQNLIVVNCGAPASNRGEWRTAARSTAAHSTLVVDDASSVRFLSGRLERWLGPLILEGPGPIEVHREDTPDHVVLTAAHDGYQGRFGVIHERAIALTADGRRLNGIDRLQPAEGGAGRAERYAIRFHLHPSVRASRAAGGSSVLIVCPDGEAWQFTANGAEIALEESIFLAGLQGVRRTEQIVLHGRVDANPDVAWRFDRQAAGRNPARRAPPPEAPRLF